MASRTSADRDAVERDYRLGQLTLRALAEKHGTTASTISRWAEKFGWVQDASREVRERTRAALLVPAEDCNSVAQQRNTPTREDIEVAVLTNLAVIGRHRKDIGKGQALVGMLFNQLEEAATLRAQIISGIEAECENDATTARRSQMLKAVSLPSHAGVIRDLSTALKNLIPLERQAYNLDDAKTGESIEDALERLANGS